MSHKYRNCARVVALSGSVGLAVLVRSQHFMLTANAQPGPSRYNPATITPTATPAVVATPTPEATTSPTPSSEPAAAPLPPEVEPQNAPPQRQAAATSTFSAGAPKRETNLPPSVPVGSADSQHRRAYVTISPAVPARSKVQFYIVNGGGQYGSAEVVADASRHTSGYITIEGRIQTAIGVGRHLQVGVKVDGKDMGLRGTPFAVCGHPTRYTDTFERDINESYRVGVRVRDGWSSNSSNGVAGLSAVQIAEIVNTKNYNNPPFGSPGIGNTSGYLPGNSFTSDEHTLNRTTFILTKPGILTRNQLCIFKCSRCGANDVTLPSSGFNIAQCIFKNGSTWYHVTTKNGAYVSIAGHSSSAGAAKVTSLAHQLP